MCTGLEIAGIFAGGMAAASMMDDTPSVPNVVQRDLNGEKNAADNEAAMKANASRAALKRSRQVGAASLLSTGAKGVAGEAATSSALAVGKQTLGA